MFDLHEDLQQVGDAIWAELNVGEDHIVPYPNDGEDSTLVSVEDHKNNFEGTSVAGITEHSAAAQTELQGLEKEPSNQTSDHFSATRLDMESWPDLPSLNPTLDRNYSDGNKASAYLDFSAEPSLQKVIGNTTVQLDGGPEVFGNDHEEKSNSFLYCDWGNIGDFDDFDRLFSSSSDSIFGNEMAANGSDFLSMSSDLMDNTLQSIPCSLVPLDKQLSSDSGPSSLMINEISAGNIEQENKGHMEKRQWWSRRKLDERSISKISSNTSGFSQSKTQNPPASLQAPMRLLQTPQYALFHDGKNMGQVQHTNQYMFPGYGYTTYSFPTITLVSNIQAEGQQAKPAASSYRASAGSLKLSSSIEKLQDIPSRSVTMTPQEKIEKLRRRQQMQALIAIQQQQQQFGQEHSRSDTMVPQTYSLRNKKPYSSGSSIVIDENVNKVFSPELIPSGHREVHKGSTISDDPFIEEKIYYQLQDAIEKMDTRTRLCIRDSLLRLAHSATERQIVSDRSSSNKSNKDEASENDTSSRRKSDLRSPAKEAETNTNPVDRMVAHLLFDRHCSKVATPTKEEIISSTPLTLEPESNLPSETPMAPSEDQPIEQETVLQPSQ